MAMLRGNIKNFSRKTSGTLQESDTTKKYRLTEEKSEYDERVIFRIQALKDFGDVAAGDLGGWVESEENLSQEGDCWIYDDAKAILNAYVSDNAKMKYKSVASDNVRVSDNALVEDEAMLFHNAIVSKNAKIMDRAYIDRNAVITDNAVIKDNAIITGKERIRGSQTVGGSEILPLADYL